MTTPTKKRNTPVTTLPDGAWPVMLTPFTADLQIDWDALDAYTDWLIEQGSAGLFPVALSGEMYELSEEERLAIARRVVERAAGRVPVIASVVESGSAELYAEAAARVAATGVDAVILIASMILGEDEDESGLAAKIRTVLDANEGVFFGIYECPLPYHRILSTDSVKWMAETGRFLFFKETSHDVALMGERVLVSEGTPMKVYNAGIETLVDSLAVGVSGLSGWVVNVYPERVAWLCANSTSMDYPEALEAQGALDRIERGMGPTYPNSAKYLLAQRGLDFAQNTRWNAKAIDEAQLQALAAANVA
jgi:4-hydroxy-tetrahydrodipicolinate synthase